MSQVPLRSVARDANTGKFVSTAYAKKHPKSTVIQKVRISLISVPKPRFITEQKKNEGRGSTRSYTANQAAGRNARSASSVSEKVAPARKAPSKTAKRPATRTAAAKKASLKTTANRSSRSNSKPTARMATKKTAVKAKASTGRTKAASSARPAKSPTKRTTSLKMTASGKRTAAQQVAQRAARKKSNNTDGRKLRK